MKTILFFTLFVFLSLLSGCSFSSSTSPIELVNVSYDSTRELYTQYNKLFAKHWQEKTGQEVTVVQSHGGSGSQARSLIEGNAADVVTLALAEDINAVAKAGMLKSNWQENFPNDSAPYTSTVVFLVRRDNPKNIQDWSDLTRNDIGIITANPKTSGGARWIYLAAWAYAAKVYDNDEAQIKNYMQKLFANVLILSTSARSSTTTFIENNQGDVLLAWENEAYLAMQEHPDQFTIVFPSVSILAQPTVAIIDEVVDEKGTRQAATEYLHYLYSSEAQKIAADNFYRPSNKEILQQYADRFNLNMQLLSINDPIFGGWSKVNTKHFHDGGIFDQISPKSSK